MKKLMVLIAAIIIGLMLFAIHGCSDKNQLFLEALRSGDNVTAKALLGNSELDISARNKYGYTPLHLSEDVEITQLLLAKGADPNSKGGGVDPSMKPIKNVNLGKFGNFDLNELKRGKDYSPLHTVDNYKVAQVLLDSGADINALANYNVTPLHQAAEKKDGSRLVELLLTNGADVNAKANYNTTPLHEAMFYANQNGGAVVKLLVENGADVNAQDNSGHTPLHGIRGDSVKLAAYLVDHGADVTLASTSGDLPICYAIGDDKVNLMHFYIVRGKGIMSRCSNNRDLLGYAEEEATSKTLAAVKRATFIILKEFQKSKQQ